MWPYFEEVCKKQTSAKIVFMHPDLSLRSRELYRRVYQRLGTAGLVHADGRNAAPSGIEGLVFAAAVCERVHVYGRACPMLPFSAHLKYLHDIFGGVQGHVCSSLS